MGKVQAVVFTAAAVMFIWLYPSSCQSSVSVRSEVDRSTITVGDPIKYTLIITYEEDHRVYPPPLASNLGQFEIKDFKYPRTIRTDEGLLEERTEYTVTSFRTGDFQIPPLIIGFVTAEGDSGWVESEPIAIRIQSVNVEGAKDIRDIKGPVEIPQGVRSWMIWSGVALLVATAGVILHILASRKKRLQEDIATEPDVPIDELGEFDKIDALGLIEKGQYKEHYILISEALRRYIERRYKIEAMERTTYELLDDMNDARAERLIAIEKEHIESINEFLSGCDLVKFAKYMPRLEEAKGSTQRARAIVKDTYIKESKEPDEVLESEASRG